MMEHSCRSRFLALTIVLLTLSLFAAGQVAVTTYHNDNYRSGANTNETILTPSNVNEVQFGKKLVLPVTGYVYAQPLYVPNVNINGKLHNMVYVVTEHDQAYGFDANTGQQMWEKNFLLSSNFQRQIYPVSSNDIDCSGNGSETGITSTPVIDLSTNLLYTVAATKEVVNHTSKLYQRMHVLDIATGVEKQSGPFFGAPIQAKTPGTGAGSIDGWLYFDPTVENQRAALTLSNGLVFAAWGAYCDVGNFHGYVMAFNTKNMFPSGVFVTTPNGYDGGLWASGSGPAVDTTGDFYFPTGNGLFDAYLGGTEYGDSMLRISWDGGQPNVDDYFTPWDQASLDYYDWDVASGGILLLPDQPGTQHPHLLVQVAKEGTIDLVDRDNMGHYSPGGDTQIVQTLPMIISGVWGAPAMWNNNLYFGGQKGPLVAFSYDPVAQLIRTPLTSATPETFGYPGPTPSISSNGASNGIVWIVQNDTFQGGGHAILRAYDANNLATELYNSDQNPARDQAGGAIKFTVPTIADGLVFIPVKNEVDVYGLLN